MYICSIIGVGTALGRVRSSRSNQSHFLKVVKVDTQRILDNIQQIDLLNKYFDERYQSNFFGPVVCIFFGECNIVEETAKLQYIFNRHFKICLTLNLNST